jgi:hypothetical protein
VDQYSSSVYNVYFDNYIIYTSNNGSDGITNDILVDNLKVV